MDSRLKPVPALCLSAFLGIALLSGCASSGSGSSEARGGATSVTVTDPTRLTRTGFLSDYARLKPTSWGNGIECWRDAHLDAKQYDKVMISRIVLSLKAKAGEAATVDPSDLKTLTDYFHDSLVNALKLQGCFPHPMSGKAT